MPGFTLVLQTLPLKIIFEIQGTVKLQGGTSYSANICIQSTPHKKMQVTHMLTIVNSVLQKISFSCDGYFCRTNPHNCWVICGERMLSLAERCSGWTSELQQRVYNSPLHRSRSNVPSAKGEDILGPQQIVNQLHPL